MEETRVNVEDDANDHVNDVAVGKDFDSSQPKARSRKLGLTDRDSVMMMRNTEK